jgi:hypothetical protein
VREVNLVKSYAALRSTEVTDDDVLELSTGNLSDLEALYSELYGTSGIRVEAEFARIEPEDQGALIEFLTVSCEGGAITIFLQIVKALVDSRGPQFVLKIRHGKDRIEVNAKTIDEALPIIRALIDGS